MEKKIRVLLVEDSEDDAILLLRELKKGNYQPEHKIVESAESLRNALSSSHWDIIISDYYLQGFDALEVIEIVKQNGYSDIPFIIVSGAIGEETAVTAMRAGAHDYIMKGKLKRLIPAIDRELKEYKVKLERKKAQETIKQNELRFKALYNLSRMEDSSQEDIEAFVVEEAIKLTKSEIGFIGYVDEENNALNVNYWSGSVLDGCNTKSKTKFFSLDNPGLWAEAVREKKPIIINNYDTFQSAHKKGFAEGHLKVNRYMSIPVFYKDRIIFLMSVGNKKEEYNDRDVQQLQLLVNGMWWNIQKRDNEKRIKESLEEKEILLKEIHHRVKNNLQIISSLLNLQSRQIKSDHYLNIFKESQNRIKTMALVHEKLYQSKKLSLINFSNYIQSVIINLFHSYNINSDKIQLDIDIDNNISMGIDLAIPCGLIVNELISNSMKYAFPIGSEGRIYINLKKEGSNFTMIVSDNGIGLEDDIDIENIESLGLQLVTALVKQIDGNLILDNSNGTKFTISFNTLNKKERKIY